MSALVLQGGVVHYEYFGRGHPLIFIHGWLGSWRYWVPVMDALSEEYRVYAFDLWGFGDSDKSRERYDIPSYVRLLDAFVQELGVRGPVPLVGHALGAIVAITFATERPDFIDRIMAVSLPLHGDSINQKLLSGESSLWDRMLGRSPVSDYEDVKREMDRTAPAAISQSIQSISNLDLSGKLKRLRTPLLVVQGEQDNVVAPEDVTKQIGMNSSVRTMMIPQCRHFPMLDRGSQFNRLLLDFLKASKDLNELELKAEWQRRIR